MHRPIARRWLALVGGAAAAAGALLPVSGAWAPHVAQLQVTPTTFKAGDTVTVFWPSGYGATNPVEVRLDSSDGPVLGSFKTSGSGFAMWGPGTITIPADVQPGVHTLWATQKLEESEKLIRGVPSKAIVQVLNADGSAPVVGLDLSPQIEQRPTDLIEDKPVSTGALILVGLGVAGIAMFAAGGAALAASRKRGGAAPEAVRR
jgi:hypothetical protein